MNGKRKGKMRIDERTRWEWRITMSEKWHIFYADNIVLISPNTENPRDMIKL